MFVGLVFERCFIMQQKKILFKEIYLVCIMLLSSYFLGCTNNADKDKKIQHDKSILNVALGAEVPSLDPQNMEDMNSVRVANDIFEGLVTFDQSNIILPAMAKYWDVSSDGKKYTFHLRDDIKFSDGKEITADDFVYSWQRLVDPKTGSPYSYFIDSIINAKEITNGKLDSKNLGVKAINNRTFEVNLVFPDHDFLTKCGLAVLYVVPKNIVTKYGKNWVDPEHIVTSGPYVLTQHVVNGHISLKRNPYYYDIKNVAIENINFYPLVDSNSAIAKYKTGGLETTWTIPVDQLKELKNNYKDQVKVVPIEATVYYNINMARPEFKDIRLRQALTMAIDRDIITKNVLTRGTVALYGPVTVTVDNAQYDSVQYAWKSLSKLERIKQAKQLYKDAGYSENKPLKLTITYYTDDEQKKVALAIASMWSSSLGIKVDIQNQDWKTFIQTRHNGDYQISFGRWYADYNGVSSYTPLFLCNSPSNDSKYCNNEYDKYINLANYSLDSKDVYQYNLKALNIVLNDYTIIPLYQNIVKRMVKPYVKGYTPDMNHLDMVKSKWMHY
jgi:oligopeptide transport system substrate-binding protein